MFVIILNEDSIVAVGKGLIGREVKVLADIIEDEDRAGLGPGIAWTARERLAVVFASARGCELIVVTADKLGPALADKVVEEELGVPLAGRLSALIMSAAFNVRLAMHQVVHGVENIPSRLLHTRLLANGQLGS